ncbi:archease [Candidatus Woesearchaeota archaeon]|jgi:SHS2 domain-containing protein|nr:archease [Candidatus Woesearchaeota archaeon]
MSYKFLEHGGEEGILGEGKTLESAFSEGAKAMFAVMVDIKKVKADKSINISCESDNKESLFIEFLNELIAQKDIKEMVFSKFDIKVKESNNKFKLSGKAHGEKFDADKHKPKIEVKAATYSGLKVWKENNNYKARCVIDV